MDIIFVFQNVLNLIVITFMYYFRWNAANIKTSPTKCWVLLNTYSLYEVQVGESKQHKSGEKDKGDYFHS